MTIQEAIDAADVNRMLHLRFKGLLDLLDRSNLASLSSGEKRLQQGLFLLEGKLFVVASALFGLVNDSRSHAIVRRDDPMHCCG